MMVRGISFALTWMSPRHSGLVREFSPFFGSTKEFDNGGGRFRIPRMNSENTYMLLSEFSGNSRSTLLQNLLQVSSIYRRSQPSALGNFSPNSTFRLDQRFTSFPLISLSFSYFHLISDKLASKSVASYECSESCVDFSFNE